MICKFMSRLLLVKPSPYIIEFEASDTNENLTAKIKVKKGIRSTTPYFCCLTIRRRENSC